jgi:hypothetical protein
LVEGPLAVLRLRFEVIELVVAFTRTRPPRTLDGFV